MELELKSVLTVEVVAAEWKVPMAGAGAKVVVAVAEYGAEEKAAAEVAAEEATAEVTAAWAKVLQQRPPWSECRRSEWTWPRWRPEWRRTE
jgi:hypothetical protein